MSALPTAHRRNSDGPQTAIKAEALVMLDPSCRAKVAMGDGLARDPGRGGTVLRSEGPPVSAGATQTVSLSAAAMETRVNRATNRIIR
jgi:hypothetical protein